MGVTALYIVRNEIERLPCAVAEIAPFVDEVFIVDQSSDDGTAEWVAQSGHRYATQPCLGFCEASYPSAIPACLNEWVLLIFPDEECTTWFKTNLRALCQDPNVDYYVTPRIIFIGNSDRPLDYVGRLFRKSCVTLPSSLHSTPASTTGRQVTIDRPCIISCKTNDEQELDNERYYSVGYPRP